MMDPLPAGTSWQDVRTGAAAVAVDSEGNIIPAVIANAPGTGAGIGIGLAIAIGLVIWITSRK